jgi:hypothetical protein
MVENAFGFHEVLRTRAFLKNHTKIHHHYLIKNLEQQLQKLPSHQIN